MNIQELQAALEAIIYASDEPVSLGQLAMATEADKAEVRPALDLLVAKYQTDQSGIEIRKVAGGWKMYTKPQHHDVVRKFIKALRPPVRLTMPALETLAVIAYKQPVTGPEINDIRGVNCGGVLKTLLEKRLISTAGRKEVMGRPILYRTSKDFLMRFGLSDLEELPSLKEFEQLAQAALGSDDGIAPTEPAEGVEQGATPEAGRNAMDATASDKEGAVDPGAGTAEAESMDADTMDSESMDSESMTSEVNAEEAQQAERSSAAGAGTAAGGGAGTQDTFSRDRDGEPRGESSDH